MSIFAPLRLDRMSTALFNALTEATDADTVTWSYGTGSWETMGANVVSMTMSGPPAYHNLSGARGTGLVPPTSVDIGVSGTTSGVLNIIEVNDFAYGYETQVGDDADVIRDGLIASLNSDPLDPFTASIGGAGIVRIVPDSFGAIWEMAIRGQLSLSDLTLSDDAVLLTQGTKRMVVDIECFSKGTELHNGANALMSQVEAALEATDIVNDMAKLGLAVWGKGTPIDLSAIAGAFWETRALIPVTFAMVSSFTRPVSTIETVVVTTNFRLISGGPIIQTETTTVTAP